MGSPTGAGLGLDPQALRFIESWLDQPDHLHSSTIPLTIDQNQATDSEKKISWSLSRDENFNFRAAHWSELHSLLYKSLPSDVVQWGHQFLSFQTSHDKAFVRVEAKVLQTDEVVEIVGDLLSAADGCLSAIRQHFLPDLKLSGRCCPPNVVLVGDAAHPTSPHGHRSTNMSILDARALGQCLERWGLDELQVALEEYQLTRLPVVSKQVLHSRRMGLIKQGLDLHDRKVFDPKTATPEECEELQQ